MNCIMVYVVQCSWLKMSDLTNRCWAGDTGNRDLGIGG